jgi:hypothetical protein
MASLTESIGSGLQHDNSGTTESIYPLRSRRKVDHSSPVDPAVAADLVGV